MQKTKKRMGFTFKIQEAEVIREALKLAPNYSGAWSGVMAKLEKNIERRLAREQEWVAAGGKVSHAG